VTRRVLVAGVGNIFLGDDGFGVEVANRLAGQALPDGVEVTDFGIRGVHLAYQLLDGYDALVLVDAVQRGDEPGTLTVIEPEPPADSRGRPPAVDAHGMDPASVLGMLAGLGGEVERVLVVGCEAGRLEDEIGLSEPVAEAVPRAVQLVMDLVTQTASQGAEISMSAGAARPNGNKEKPT
jgi:hydrogenase maturation protease